MSAGALEHALRYLAAGLSVVHIPAGVKKPSGKWEALQKKRATERQVRAWFADGGNVGIICGAISGGLLVIDFDTVEIYQRFMAKFGQLVAGLPVVKTGKGYHIYLRCPVPGGNRKLAAAGKVKLIETRGEGGLVLAPGSIHPDTGKPYELLAGDLARVPLLEQALADSILQACQSFEEPPARPARPIISAEIHPSIRQGRYALKALSNEADRVRLAAAGDRNNQLNRSAFALGQLVGGGELSRAEVSGTLAAAARAAGLSDAEILPTLNSGLAKGESQPRNAPPPTYTNGHTAGAAIVEPPVDLVGPDNGTDLEQLLARAGDIQGTPDECREQAVAIAGDAGMLKTQDWHRLRGILRKASAPASVLDQAWRESRQEWKAQSGGSPGRPRVSRMEIADALERSWQGLTLYHQSAEIWRRWDRRAWLEVQKDELLNETVKVALELGMPESDITAAGMKDAFEQIGWRKNLWREEWDLVAGVYFSNARMDPEAQTFEPHTPSNFNTYVLPYDWQPKAKCPKWQAHMKRSVPDPAGRRATAEHIALAMASDRTFHKALVNLGPPRAGKSVTAEVLRALLGDFATETSAMIFREGDSESGKRMVRLRDSRLVTIDELPQDALEGDTIFKRMAAHGKVEARGIFRDSVEFRWGAKFLFSTNVAPRIFDRSGAVAARLLFVEYPNSLLHTPGEINRLLAQEIITEELPGVAVWAMSAYADLLQRNTYSESAVMLKLNEQVVKDSDPLQAFVEECCVRGDACTAEARELYKEWKGWAVENGYQPGNRVTFKHNLEASRMAAYGLHPVTRRAQWAGIGLRTDPFDPKNV